ncbi:MAG: hypothetical protein WA830_09865 [Candidatus Sulfotelmatobacter sp.]
MSSSDLHLTQHDVLETHGLSVLLYHNAYHRVFGDQKMNGMEIILHDQRIATSGDVRLSATPEQWDPIPDFKERKRGAAADEVTAFCTYPDRGLSYRIDVRPKAGGFRNNRAEYTFVPGGMIPGVVILQPDLPELKESWPFLWYENEYVVDAVTSFILAANAADAETRSTR